METLTQYMGNNIRVIIIDSEPWWVAQEVSDLLEISEARSSTRDFDPDEKGVHTVHTPGGNQQVLIVSEPGLYRLIFKSRKPEAKKFLHWITHEVLPEIRKTGKYESPSSTSSYEEAKQQRKKSVKGMIAHGARGPRHIAILTNDIYQESLGARAPELRKLKGLGQRENVRANLTDDELYAVTLIESGFHLVSKKRGDKSFLEQRQSIHDTHDLLEEIDRIAYRTSDRMMIEGLEAIK